jgi:hypothetical protein
MLRFVQYLLRIRCTLATLWWHTGCGTLLYISQLHLWVSFFLIFTIYKGVRYLMGSRAVHAFMKSQTKSKNDVPNYELSERGLSHCEMTALPTFCIFRTWRPEVGNCSCILFMPFCRLSWPCCGVSAYIYMGSTGNLLFKITHEWVVVVFLQCGCLLLVIVFIIFRVFNSGIWMIRCMRNF